jgi:hypothetical protein
MNTASRTILAMAFAVLIAPHGAAAAPGARYELFPDPTLHRTIDHRVSSAYVIDKQDNRFWVCTVDYNFSSENDNKGACQLLPTAIGRPTLTPAYDTQAILGSPLISPELPVFWFIEPTSGDIQFCAPRHLGTCVRLKLPPPSGS